MCSRAIHRVISVVRGGSEGAASPHWSPAAPAHADRSLWRDGKALAGGAQKSQPRLPPSSRPLVFLPVSAMGFQVSNSAHCSQFIRASRTPRLLSQAIGKSFCNPAFELRGYCRLQWVY